MVQTTNLWNRNDWTWIECWLICQILRKEAHDLIQGGSLPGPPSRQREAAETVSPKAFQGIAPARLGQANCSGGTGNAKVVDCFSGWWPSGISSEEGPPKTEERRAIPAPICRLPPLPLFALITTSICDSLRPITTDCKGFRCR